MTKIRSNTVPDASGIDFDNTGTNFISDTVEGAIKEINSAALAGGSVNSDGSSNRILNATSSRISTGEYRITFDTAVTDADYPVIVTLESNAGSDDYIVSYSNLTTTSFDVSINEQDNGTSPGTPRDSAFSFLIPNISTQAGPENDHGALVGLGDDDHPQYLNNTRGDARYYTETELDSGQLDSRYYTESELDSGQLDNRYYTETELDGGQLDNRYYTETEIDAQQQIQDDNLTDHINDPTDAHDATAISFDNSTNGFTADDVQEAIEEAKDQAQGFPRAGLPLIYNGTVGNNDLISYSNLTPTTPIIFPVNTQINEITFSNDRNNVEGDIELWVNGVGSGTLIKTININTGAGVNNQFFDLNVDNLTLTPGQELQLRYIDQGTNARDAAIVLWISRIP